MLALPKMVTRFVVSSCAAQMAILFASPISFSFATTSVRMTAVAVVT